MNMLEYNYRVVSDNYFLFNNQVPFGPVQLLHNSIHARVFYFDYDNKIQVVHKPFEKETLHLAYFSLPDSSEFWHLLHILPLLNVVKASISIYCSESCLSNLKQYTNPHIQLYDLDVITGKTLIETNAVISFSPAALYFIKQQIPVIIAGTKGIGGLVTPYNFHYLSKEGFWGRPGGTTWENLPPKVFMHELQSLIGHTEIAQMSKACAALAEELPWFPNNMAQEVEAQIGRHVNKIHSENERWKIVPSLAPDILFVRSDNQYLITRKPLNQIIASTEDTDFFRLVNGKNDFAEILRQSDMETAEFWETITELVKQKIIIY
jgi:hypothetical protein